MCRSADRPAAGHPLASRGSTTRRIRSIRRIALAVGAGLAAACGTGCRPAESVTAAGATGAVSGPATSASVRFHGRAGLPAATPEQVGMSTERLAVLDRVVARGIAEGGYPGAALVIGRRGHAVWERGYGTLAWRSGSAAVTPDSALYDLASLTKVVATTSAVMALVDDGRLAVDAPVQRYVPGFRGPGKEAVTVRHLLEHRSGLAPGVSLRRSRSPAAARRRVLAAPLAAPPGRWVEYSDVGMMVLGFVVEAASGEPLDAYLRRRVFTPLGMRQTTFRPARSPRLAPTGGTVDAVADGRVHDTEAAALGGVAGHAGLFSTAADLAVYAQTLLGGGVGPNGVRVFADSTVRTFLQRGPGGTRRALGWETCSTDRVDACGRLLDERAVMHTGFTGTYLVIDRARQAFAVLLTNRVHAPRAAQSARVIRDVRADVSDCLALAVADAPGGLLPMPVAFRADTNVGVWQARPAKPTRAASARQRPTRLAVITNARGAKTRRPNDGRRKARA